MWTRDDGKMRVDFIKYDLPANYRLFAPWSLDKAPYVFSPWNKGYYKSSAGLYYPVYRVYHKDPSGKWLISDTTDVQFNNQYKLVQHGKEWKMTITPLSDYTGKLYIDRGNGETQVVQDDQNIIQAPVNNVERDTNPDYAADGVRRIKEGALKGGKQALYYMSYVNPITLLLDYHPDPDSTDGWNPFDWPESIKNALKKLAEDFKTTLEEVEKWLIIIGAVLGVGALAIIGVQIKKLLT